VNTLTTPRHSTPTGSSDGQPTDTTTPTTLTASSRTWTVTTTTGHTTTGYLPSWATHDPSRTGVPVDQLGLVLADISHCARFSGPSMPIATDDGPGTDTVILDGSIDRHPYAENPDARIPVVHPQITDDHWINNVNPDELAVVAAKLRAHADYLDSEVAPALVAARADWAAHQAG
jgi:hypothetical protein